MTKKTKTIRVKIKQAHITEAAKKAEVGMPPMHVDIYADESIAGLQLRVQAKRAFWYLKRGDGGKNIGEVASPKPMTREVPSITEARELATACKKVLDSQADLIDAILKRYFEAPIGDRDFEEARTDIRRKPTTWTFRKCFEHVIEVRSTPDKKGKVQDTYEFELTMKREVMQDLLDKPAVSLERGDFDDVRIVISNEFGISAANKALSNCRVVLDYCMRKASKLSGLDHKDPWWKLIEGAGEVGKRNRAPSIDEIVKIMVVAEDFLDKPLPGRSEKDGKAGVRASVFAAAWWLVLTVQRTYAALHLPRDNFFPDKEAPGEGWYLASWPEDVMKVVEFALPIPPRVVQHMLPLIEAAKNETNSRSQWAFPSGRKPRKSSKVQDITVNESGVRQMLQRLRGRDPLLKEEDDDGKLIRDGVDFFKVLGVPWWTPHDLRRTIGKELDKAGIPGGSSAVLAHKIKMPERPMNDREREDWLEQHVEDITRAAYHDPTHMHLKAKAMLIWTDMILDRYEQLSPKRQAILALQKRARIEPFIYRDITFIDAALKLAREQLPEAISAARKDAEMQASIFAEYSSRSDVRIQHMMEQQEKVDATSETLRKLVEEPHLFLASKSLELRGRTLGGIMQPDYAVFDFAAEAPDYLEERARYVAGHISRPEFEAHMVWKYGFDFSTGSDNIYLPGKDPRQALQQAA
ncbi:hypothetical protein ELI02_02265 [Rhizobium leguminosarum]|uniref:hypothetical protein n=1 Tax=Rhizobium leguminosarum TaxID=384 RepID=UPI0010309B26|nr:hypothetical protein [Rhizobium leguminosarum]TAX58943.1 hypothetical protein ELI02_02265 [Rhizobium leguminosarum]